MTLYLTDDNTLHIIISSPKVTVQLFSENYSLFYGVGVISRVQIIPPSPFPDQETPSGAHAGPSYQLPLSANVKIFPKVIPESMYSFDLTKITSIF